MDKIKSFFATLKKQMKDPITSMEDANTRKKAYMKYLWFLLAGAVLGSVLGGLGIPVVSIIFGLIGVVSVLLLMLDLLLIMIASKSRKAFEDTFCKSCGNQITYGDNVRYTILNVSRKMVSSSEKANLKEYTKVSFDCTCQSCGASKSFLHEFCTGNFTADGGGAIGYTHPLEKQIADYFVGKLTIAL